MRQRVQNQPINSKLTIIRAEVEHWVHTEDDLCENIICTQSLIAKASHIYEYKSVCQPGLPSSSIFFSLSLLYRKYELQPSLPQESPLWQGQGQVDEGLP